MMELERDMAHGHHSCCRAISAPCTAQGKATPKEKEVRVKMTAELQHISYSRIGGYKRLTLNTKFRDKYLALTVILNTLQKRRAKPAGASLAQ